MSSKPNKTPAKFKPAKLKEHPRQAEMFGDVDEQKLGELVENMRIHGLQHPIEILPDGTIIAGHQRVRAAIQLGWKELDVIIRHDLAAQGDAAVERYFVEDNFVRRQLSPLARAKCIRLLLELAVGKATRSFGYTQKEKLKSEIAERMNLSVRSVNRYLLLLNAPIEIQIAFDRGDLTLITAGKFTLLEVAAQMKVIQRIQAGEKPASVMREVLRSKPGGQKSEVCLSYGRIMSVLKRELPKINGQVNLIAPQRMQTSTDTLDEAIQILTKLRAVAKQRQNLNSDPVTDDFDSVN